MNKKAKTADELVADLTKGLDIRTAAERIGLGQPDTTTVQGMVRKLEQEQRDAATLSTLQSAEDEAVRQLTATVGSVGGALNLQSQAEQEAQKIELLVEKGRKNLLGKPFTELPEIPPPVPFMLPPQPELATRARQDESVELQRQQLALTEESARKAVKISWRDVGIAVIGALVGAVITWLLQRFLG